MAFYDEISSVHEQKVKCASVHLFSGVHLQCMLDSWLRKYNEIERSCTEQHARQRSNFYFIIIVMIVGKYSN